MRNKKTLKFISIGIIILSLILWLFLNSLSMTVSYEGDIVRYKNTGLAIILGTEGMEMQVTGFNIIALLGALTTVIVCYLIYKESKNAAFSAVVLAVIYIFVIPVTMNFSYTKDFEWVLSFMELAGEAITWLPTYGTILATLLAAIASVICKIVIKTEEN